MSTNNYKTFPMELEENEQGLSYKFTDSHVGLEISEYGLTDDTYIGRQKFSGFCNDIRQGLANIINGEKESAYRYSIPILELYMRMHNKDRMSTKDLECVTEVVINTARAHEEDLTVVIKCIALLSYEQLMTRGTFLNRYVKDAGKMYMSLTEHLDEMTKILTKQYDVNGVQAVEFLFFLWYEYSTTPLVLGVNSMRVYMNEYKIYKQIK